MWSSAVCSECRRQAEAACDAYIRSLEPSVAGAAPNETGRLMPDPTPNHSSTPIPAPHHAGERRLRAADPSRRPSCPPRRSRPTPPPDALPRVHGLAPLEPLGAPQTQVGRPVHSLAGGLVLGCDVHSRTRINRLAHLESAIRRRDADGLGVPSDLRAAFLPLVGDGESLDGA